MPFDYFYGSDGADQYTFFRIPKLLISSKQFNDVSTDAKLLYGLMLDRLQLSIKNCWFDEKSRVYIIYTIEDIMEDLNCCNQKAIKILNELEKKAGLVIKKRRGLGKPSIIYVLNFYSGFKNKSDQIDRRNKHGESKQCMLNADSVDKNPLKCENHYSGNEENNTKKCENHTSRNEGSSSLEVCRLQCNKTNKSNTDYNETNLISSINTQETLKQFGQPKEQSDGYDEIDERNKYEDYLYERLGIEYLKNNCSSEKRMIDEIFALVLDTVTSKAKHIRCAGEDKPAEVVKSQFMKLNVFHLEYVIDSLESNVSNVKNIKAYLITSLYNAPFTMDSYYLTKVNHDMANYSPQHSNGGD